MTFPTFLSPSGHARRRILFAPVPPDNGQEEGDAGWIAWTSARPEKLCYDRTLNGAVGAALLASEEEMGIPIEMDEEAWEWDEPWGDGI